MTLAGRRGTVWASLIALGLLGGACAPQEPTAALEAPAKLQPGPGQTYLSLGSSLLAANEPALAIQAFNASMTAEGLSPEAMTGAGMAAQRQGLLTAARRYLERARDLAPQSAIAHKNLGVVLYQLEEYHDARAAFRAALELSGGESRSARAYLGQTEAALAARAPEPEEDAGETWRVVRLGTDRVRLTEAAPEPGSEAEAEAD